MDRLTREEEVQIEDLRAKVRKIIKLSAKQGPQGGIGRRLLLVLRAIACYRWCLEHGWKEVRVEEEREEKDVLY